VPLRVGLDWLATELHEQFAREGREFFGDPWAARDGGGAVADDPVDLRGTEIRGLELLELERNALAMFTSCGWFFDDVGDIATLVVLRHAARAIELAGDESGRLRSGLLRYLAEAKSNDSAIGDGAQLYLERIGRRPAATRRAAAGYAAAQAVDSSAPTDLPGYRMTANGGAVVVEDRRTARRETVPALVERPSVARVTVSIAGEPFDRNDLPERHRTIISQALVRATLRKWLSAEAIDTATLGAIDIRQLANQGLVTTARSLAHGNIESLERMTDLLDLLALIGVQGVPFDAQTEFYRAWSCASGELRRQLDAVAPRLGFTLA
jgi:hypothetical protein